MVILDGFEKKLHTISNHQILALRRGQEDSEELTVRMTVDDGTIVALMYRLLEKYGVSYKGIAAVAGTAGKQFLSSIVASDSTHPHGHSVRKPLTLNRDRIVGEIICEGIFQSC